MSTITVKGFIASSNPVPAYGGIALAPETMYDIAATIREGKVPIHANHDERHLLNPHLLKVDVRETDIGNLGVWIEFEIDEQEWQAVGNLNGFSIAVIAELFEPDPANTKPPLKIYADFGHYSKEVFQEAVAELEKHFAVSGGRLFQFNVLPPAKIVIDLVLNTVQAIPPNMLSAWLYDAIKPMILKLRLKKNQTSEQTPTSVTCVRITDENKQIDLFQMNTNDPEILKAGLSTFYSNLTPKSQANSTLLHPHANGIDSLPKPQENFYEFDNKSKKWKKHR